MDPSAILLLIEKSPQIVQKVINSRNAKQLIHKLDTMSAKIDLLYIREVKSAFEALADAYDSDNAETVRKRLEFAEDNLLRNTCLDPKMDIGDSTGSELMAMAHFGLAIICRFRDDNRLVVKHLLKVFYLEPKLAMEEIAQDFYHQALEPECQILLANWESQEVRKAQQKSYVGDALLYKTAAVFALVGGVAGGLISNNPGIAHAGLRAAGKGWEDGTPENLRSQTIASIREKKPEMMYKFCSVLAERKLSTME